MSATEVIESGGLVLTPIAVGDAVEIVGVLSDPDLYTFTGGQPPALDQLQELYRYQSAGSPGAGGVAQLDRSCRR
jgi:hypothetical protein